MNVADQDGIDPPENTAVNFVSTFTIDAAPSVTATTPANGATDPLVGTRGEDRHRAGFAGREVVTRIAVRAEPSGFTIDQAPSVTATPPADNAIDIGGGTIISVTFSESVNPGLLPLTINCTVSGAHTYVVNTANPNTTFSIDPDSNFASGDVCTVTVLAAEVADDDSNDPPDSMLANHGFDFTIDSAPVVSSTDPADNATNGRRRRTSPSPSASRST